MHCEAVFCSRNQSILAGAARNGCRRRNVNLNIPATRLYARKIVQRFRHVRRLARRLTAKRKKRHRKIVAAERTVGHKRIGIVNSQVLNCTSLIPNTRCGKEDLKLIDRVKMSTHCTLSGQPLHQESLRRMCIVAEVITYDCRLSEIRVFKICLPRWRYAADVCLRCRDKAPAAGSVDDSFWQHCLLSLLVGLRYTSTSRYYLLSSILTASPFSGRSLAFAHPMRSSPQPYCELSVLRPCRENSSAIHRRARRNVAPRTLEA